MPIKIMLHWKWVHRKLKHNEIKETNFLPKKLNHMDAMHTYIFHLQITQLKICQWKCCTKDAIPKLQIYNTTLNHMTMLYNTWFLANNITVPSLTTSCLLWKLMQHLPEFSRRNHSNRKQRVYYLKWGQIRKREKGANSFLLGNWNMFHRFSIYFRKGDNFSDFL